MSNLFFSATQKTNAANNPLTSEQFNVKTLINTDGASFKDMLTKQASMVVEKSAYEKTSTEKTSQEKINQQPALQASKQAQPNDQARQNESKPIADNQPSKPQPVMNKKLAASAKQAEVKPSNQLNQSSTKTTAESDVKTEGQVADSTKLSAENLFSILDKTKKGAEKLKDIHLNSEGSSDSTLGAIANNKMVDVSLLNPIVNLPNVPLAQSLTTDNTQNSAKSGMLNSLQINNEPSKDALPDETLAAASTDQFKRDLTQKNGRDAEISKADFGHSMQTMGEVKSAKQLDSISQMNSALTNNNNQLANQDKPENQFNNSLMMLTQSGSTSNTTQLVASMPTSQANNANQIGIPLGKNGWDQAVSQRIMLMVGSSQQTATLTLNPPDLGPLQVVVHVHNGQADTTFITDHTHVRNALENSLGTLQELMKQAGVNMGSTEFANSQSNLANQQNPKNNQQSRQAGNASNHVLDNNISSSIVTSKASSMTLRQGLVDTFA